MENKALNTCVACKETSEHVALHYTQMMCNGCRAFFKRTIQGKVNISECKFQGECVINPSTRKLCKACRFEACKKAGVDSAKVHLPKENCYNMSPEDQLLHDIHANGGQRMIPSTSSFTQQPPYLPMSLSTQGSQAAQHMYPMQPVINVHGPSIGIGVFNQNLSPSFTNGHIANPNGFMDRQLPLNLNNNNSTCIPDQGMQIWNTAFNGSMFPVTSTTTEANSRIMSAFNFPYRNSFEAYRQSDPWMYINRSMPMTRQSLSYPYSSVPTNYESAMFHTSNFPQALLANSTSHPDALSLAHSGTDSRGFHSLPGMNNVSSTLYDNSLASRTVNDTLNDQRSGIIKSDAINSLMAVSQTERIVQNMQETMKNYPHKQCNTSLNIKEEIADVGNESNNGSENMVVVNDISSQQRIGYDCSDLHNKNEQTSQSLASTTLMERRDNLSCVPQSEKASAFMIDMLLRTQENNPGMSSESNNIFTSPCPFQATQSNLQQPLVSIPHDDEVNRESIKHSASDNEKLDEVVHPTEVTFQRGMDACNNVRSCEKDIYTSTEHHMRAVVNNDISYCDLHTQLNSQDSSNRIHEVKHSTPKNEDSNITLEDFGAFITDDDTSMNKIHPKCKASNEELFREIETAEDGNVEVDSKCTNNNNDIVNDCDSYIEEKAKHAQYQHIYSSLEKAQVVSSSDSGLGSSRHILTGCEQQEMRLKIVNNDHELSYNTDSSTHDYNDENIPVSQPRKRKLVLQTPDKKGTKEARK